MDVFTKSDLFQLAELTDENCVSLYMPTHRKGRATQQDGIQLDNLVKQAKEKLEGRGMRHPDIEAMLQPAEKLSINSHVWRHMSDGLACFFSPGKQFYFRLPLNFEPQAVVGERFYVKPLFPLLSGDGFFYVLAFSQEAVRLLEGTRQAIDEVALEDMTTSLAEALVHDDPEKQLQSHTSTQSAPIGAKRSAIFHGHGVSGKRAKKDLLRYFKQVDAGLSSILQGERAPLVLAGVDYLIPIYRQANSYPNLAAEHIPGNPDKLKPKQLHKKAWEIVKPVFKKQLAKDDTLYQQLKATNPERIAVDVEQIARAAQHGRILVLFCQQGAQMWGSLEMPTGVYEGHSERQPGDWDMLDFAAVHTSLNGGKVYIQQADKMPEDVPMAAILRY